jgi:hypothetical protein
MWCIYVNVQCLHDYMRCTDFVEGAAYDGPQLLLVSTTSNQAAAGTRVDCTQDHGNLMFLEQEHCPGQTMLEK